MGQGHTGIDEKVSSALHMFSMEVFDVEQLLRYLDEIQSFTSDLGTEVKITDFYLGPCLAWIDHAHVAFLSHQPCSATA